MAALARPRGRPRRAHHASLPPRAHRHILAHANDAGTLHTPEGDRGVYVTSWGRRRLHACPHRRVAAADLSGWGVRRALRCAQEIFERKSEYQLNDSADFYFNKVDALAVAGYVPDEQDVLRSV
jgi:hypothetical protein